MSGRGVTMLIVVVAGGLVVGGVAFFAASSMVEATPPTSGSMPPPSTTVVAPSTIASTTTTTTEAPTRGVGEVPGWTVGAPWGGVSGLTMFRGNPTRTWYGTGPLGAGPPRELWRYPDGPMCGWSTVGGETTTWCGTGWTGQPVVWVRPDGITEVIFGAYDKAVHFVDAGSGVDTRAPFPTGDIVKGSVTLDPDGYPLLYFGSRDNKLRVLGLDREPVEELWSLDASAVAGIWNDDWDGNPVVVDDVMYEGGENGWFFVIRLNRGYDAEGLVRVDPEILVEFPGWTDELVSRVGRNVSIESSVAVWGRTAYFANSGGRVVGVDVSRVAEGRAPIVFDYWTGDDVDATIVVDQAGSLYVAAEYERGTSRADEVGQLVRLDPAAPGDPRRWGVPLPPEGGVAGGIWATPALYGGYLYVPTNAGRLLAVETDSGEVVWEDEVGWHAWSSPVVVDGVLLVGTCVPAELRAYDLTRPDHPEVLWTVEAAAGCIESTPAVWNGRIYLGSRDGFFRAYGW